MNKLLVLNILVFVVNIIFAQKIKNVNFKADKNKKTIYISYDIVGNTKNKFFNVNLYYKINKEKDWILIDISELSGDVGKNIKPGRNRKITWKPVLSLDGIIQFQVEAEVFKKAPPSNIDLISSFNNKPTTYLLFSNNGKYLARAWDADVYIYSFVTGKLNLIKKFSDHSQNISCMTFSPKNNFFATGGEDCKVCIYSLKNGNISKIKEIQTNFKTISNIAFSPDEKYFITSSLDSTLNFYFVNSGDFSFYKRIPFNGYINTFVVYSTYLFCLVDNQILEIYDLKKFAKVDEKKFNFKIQDLSIMPENEILIISTFQEGIKFFSINNLKIKELKFIDTNILYPTFLSISQNNIFAIGNSDILKIFFYLKKTIDLTYFSEMHYYDACFTPDNQYLIVGGEEGLEIYKLKYTQN